jgi:hypothetical protein
VCVVIVNVLCCWFRIFKERGGCVLLSVVERVQCSEYAGYIQYIDVRVVHK